MTTKEVRIGKIPTPPAVDLNNFKVLTPHRGAADSLGVSHHSLKQVATRLLKSRGYEVASSSESVNTLVGVIRDLFPDTEPFSMASAIMLTLQTVLRTGINLSKLEENGSEKVKRLAQIAGEYQFRLRKKALIDPEAVHYEASLLPIKPRKLLVYGYHRARFEEINLLKKLSADGSIFYLPSGSESIFKTNQLEAESLEEDGWNISNFETIEDSYEVKTLGQLLALKFIGKSIPEINRGVSAFEYPDVETEVRAVLTQVKDLILSGASPKEIVLVSRDASIYGQTVLRIIWEYGISVQLMYRIPLTETLFGAWMNVLIRCLEYDVSFEKAARLFYHPLGTKLPDDVWEKAKSTRPQSINDWLEIGAELDVLVLPEAQSRRDWISSLFSILDFFQIRNKVGVWARELIAFQNFQDELRKNTEDLEEIITRSDFLGEVSAMLSLIAVPFHPAAGGVEFHEPNTILGANYKFVFVLGVAEGILPGSVTDNPVVDFYERRRLAELDLMFENAADVTRWEALSFYFLLLIATGEISFSYPRLIKGSEHLPSPFFARLGLSPKKSEGFSLIASSPEEQRRILLRQTNGFEDEQTENQIKKALEVENKRESANPCDEFDGVVGISTDPLNHTWSASQLTSIGQCPFKWFASKVLKLKTLARHETELSPMTRGNLYHKTLELAVKNVREGEDLRQGALENLENAFCEAENNPEIAVTQLTAWNAQRLEHLDTLRRAIEAPDFIESEAIVKETEFSFEGDWCGLKLEGQIDRIDESSNGKITVIDYKTGASVPHGVKDESGKLEIDIQIPIYIEAGIADLPTAEDNFNGLSQQSDGYYYSISKAKILKRISADQIEVAHSFAEKVKSHLIDGNYPVEPDNDENACRYCDYDAVCRKGYRLTRKRNR